MPTSRRGTAPTTDGMHFHRSRTVAMLWHVMHLIVGCFQLLHLRPPSWVSGPHMTIARGRVLGMVARWTPI